MSENDKEILFDVKMVAKAVRRAAEIHEESWACQNGHGGCTDCGSGKYSIDMEDAVQQAVRECNLPEPMWYVLHLVFHWWNDLLAWSDAILDGTWKDFFAEPEEEKEVKA